MTICPCGQIIRTGRPDKKYCDRTCLVTFRPNQYTPSGRVYHKWNTQQMRFVRDHMDMTDRMIAESIGIELSQVRSFRRRVGIRRVA